MMISTATAAGAALLMKGAPGIAVAAPSDGSGGTSAESVRPEPNENLLPPGEPGKDYDPVITPNGATLPFKIVGGVKVMHLIAEEFEHEFAPGLKARCWGYNGRTPGPTIEVVEGDRVRIYVTNKLPEATTVHWHAILLPNGMDGVAALTQKPIQPGETFKYEFTIRQHGTGMYHPHFDEMTQMGLGMMGMFVMHPRKPQQAKINRDFALMLSEWRIDPGTRRPNPNEMTDFNILTINSKAFPGTAPLVAKVGDRVRIRIGNLGAMDHHPIHLHGYRFRITQTDGGQIDPPGQQPETTVLVAVGTTRTIEFVADAPGDWALHCHMTHHVMNQMGHGLPNMIGVKTGGFDPKVRSLIPSYMTMGNDGMGNMAEMGMTTPENSIPMVGGNGPFGYIDMGGMFTVLKVRQGVANYDDPGWYEHPQGTVAGPASEEELRRDLKDAAPANAATTQGATLYTCTMHPEVVSDTPGNCPKCGMKLVVKK
jgi:FtsP/CotA-like multicopper oxidase with cupredoxin domain